MIKFNDSGMERIYDKPLLETENKPELEEHNKAVFKGFLGSLNGMEQIQNQIMLSRIYRTSVRF